MIEPYINWKQVGDTSKGVAILSVAGREFFAATVFGSAWGTVGANGEPGLVGVSTNHEMAKEEALAAAEKQGFLSAVKIEPHMYEDPAAHKERHKLLHRMLDELLADYIDHSARGGIGKTTIMEFLTWSYAQTLDPSVKHDE